MGDAAFTQGRQAVAALEQGHQAAAGVPAGDAGQFDAQPAIVLGAQLQVGERIEAMTVESGGHQQQLRLLEH